MKEIINEMLEMQRHLDKVIMDAQGITYDTVSVKQYYQAVLDEII